MTTIARPYFFAYPAAPAPWPGIVVIHEGNGISPQLLRTCQRLAAEGYAAISPDLFFRSGGTEAKGFAELIGDLQADQVMADVGEAADILRSMGATRMGVTGFCMGGLQTWRAATGGAAVDAAVGFYGGGIAKAGGTPRCPTLLFFGGQDEYVPMTDVDQVVAMHPDTVVYPDAGHGFMRDGSDSYHEQSATDAWEKTLAFFDRHLR
jgi:carboxymethylenebutenolidase